MQYLLVIQMMIFLKGKAQQHILHNWMRCVNKSLLLKMERTFAVNVTSIQSQAQTL